MNAVRPTAAQLTLGQSARLVIGTDTVFEANDAGTAAGNTIAGVQVATAVGFNGVNRRGDCLRRLSYWRHRNRTPNASPIAITAAGHGLSTGNQVEISGVLGNTAANGSFVVTVLDANTFRLDGSTGNGTYAGGGSWRRANPEVLYVGSLNEVWIRTTAGGMLTKGGNLVDLAGNAAADIRDVVVDPAIGILPTRSTKQGTSFARVTRVHRGPMSRRDSGHAAGIGQ